MPILLAALLAVQPPDLGAVDASLTARFTPARLPAGIYRAYRHGGPLEPLAGRLRELDPRSELGSWVVRHQDASEVFAHIGPYERMRVARLFTNTRPRVARGSLIVNGERLAFTLVSPYPDPSLERLEPGTLVLVFNVTKGIGNRRQK
jgi:hypothetical protein